MTTEWKGEGQEVQCMCAWGPSWQEGADLNTGKEPYHRAAPRPVWTPRGLAGGEIGVAGTGEAPGGLPRCTVALDGRGYSRWKGQLNILKIESS